MPSSQAKGSLAPDRAVVVEGKKFLWDGRLYDSRDGASQQTEAYKKDNFEVQLVQQGEMLLLYTRRVVKQLAVTAP